MPLAIDSAAIREQNMTLKELKEGQSCVVEKVGGEGALRQHFLDMGIIPGAEITLVQYAPMGDPMELRLYGYELTLRLADAEQIEVSEAPVKEPEHVETKFPKDQKAKELKHPRIGEVYSGHDYAQEHAKGPVNTEKLVFALVGNQNCGKTTLFNQLTGSNQHVGNFPGVTVDSKSGAIKGHPETEVVDLPGIYSLSPYTSEEIVSRKFIIEERPTAIINIIDATNIERNLYLTLQLMGLGIPMVLAVNMMDELRGNGGSIRINEMEELLQIPVVPISAAKNEGIDELVTHALHVAAYDEKPGRVDFCDSTSSGGAVHRAIHGVMHLIEDHCERAKIPVRFAASKLIEGDEIVARALELDDNELDMLGHIVDQMEKERGLDRAAAIADMRFSFIRKTCESTVIKPRESKEHERSRKIDRILTGKYTAIPLFILIMAGVFFLTFNVIGAFFQKLLTMGIDYLTGKVDGFLTAVNVAPPVHSLVIDAIFNGVGTVVSFAPIIVVMFFFLSLLEDSGYMARVAFVMDKLLRKIGLSGRSIVPLLIGFGCSVPAAMSTRTLPSTRDRRMTTLLIPFMSCSAKTPIYAFICAAFFPGYSGLVMTGLYFLGILIAVLVAFITKSTVFKGEAVPFVMELPNYRLPGIKNVARLMWDKAKDFLSRAFSVIFIGTIVVWFLKTFDFRFNMVTESGSSILETVAGLIAPVFAPLGLGDWKIVTSLIAGFLAKENIVSMLTVLYGGVAGMTSALSSVDALALLVFCLLYTPCIAAVAAVRRERGVAFAAMTVLFQCVIAWIVAFLVHLIGMLVI